MIPKLQKTNWDFRKSTLLIKPKKPNKEYRQIIHKGYQIRTANSQEWTSHPKIPFLVNYYFKHFSLPKLNMNYHPYQVQQQVAIMNLSKVVHKQQIVNQVKSHIQKQTYKQTKEHSGQE